MIKMPEIKAPKKKRERKKPIALIPKMIHQDMCSNQLTIELPIHTVSEGNNFDSWREKNARHKSQKRIVWSAVYPIRDLICLPCTIQMTRVAPKPLDVHDNLPMSLKYVVDALCAEITGESRAGLADNDERIKILSPYKQIKDGRNPQAYGVIIEINF